MAGLDRDHRGTDPDQAEGKGLAWRLRRPVVPVAKAGLRAYGMATARGRVLPDFLVIGAKRGGSTSLYRNLVRTPGVLPLFPRRAQVKGTYFFDVEHHPKISFRSRSATVLTAGRYTVPGELTIRGITQPVRLLVDVFGRAPDVLGNPRLGLEASAKVQRALWGITWNAPVPGGGVALADEVELELDVSLVPAGAARQPS